MPLSLGRLAAPDAIRLFREVFEKHGALGVVPADLVTRVHSESERLQVLPLIFGLLPRSAVIRDRYDVTIKPAIREHFEVIGITQDEDLIEICKRIADQLFLSVDKNSQFSRQKKTMRDVRAGHRVIYSSMYERQGGRCVVCGASFRSEATETLDHIIPWRLLGDVDGGHNWQILCEICNRGKGDVVSHLQNQYYYNWLYDRKVQRNIIESREFIHECTRFIALDRRRHCEAVGCGAVPSESRLHAVVSLPGCLPTLDFVQVFCDHHLIEMMATRKKATGE